jgi:hypothetical protein
MKVALNPAELRLIVDALDDKRVSPTKVRKVPEKFS